MKLMSGNSIRRLRIVGFAEGTSLLVLMFIAMPLKYFAGKPEAVKIIGWIHGFLFILFMLMVFIVFLQKKWPFKKLLFAFLAAFLPFGTFVFDAQLKKEQNIEESL
jgi:integral membrane protein